MEFLWFNFHWKQDWISEVAKSYTAGSSARIAQHMEQEHPQKQTLLKGLYGSQF